MVSGMQFDGSCGDGEQCCLKLRLISDWKLYPTPVVFTLKF